MLSRTRPAATGRRARNGGTIPSPVYERAPNRPPTARFDVSPLNLFRRGSDHTDEGRNRPETILRHTPRSIDDTLPEPEAAMTFRSRRTARSVARTIAVAGLLTGIAIAAPAPATSKTS